MNIKFIYIGAVISGFILSYCNPNTQRNRTANVELRKDTVKVNQTPNSLLQINDKSEVPVLCFHRIAVGMKSDYEVSPSAFESYIKILADSGYNSISPSQLYDYLVFNKELPKKPVMITFDDSRIEHFEIAAPVLEKYGFRGVFFIMTITLNKKNYMTRNEIAEMAEKGHTIGLHSWDHTMVTKYKNADDWKKQVEQPEKNLEKITGGKVEYWAYPDGVFDHKSAEELGKYFKLSFILSNRRDPELPLQTLRRMIVPSWTPVEMLKVMHRTFH